MDYNPIDYWQHRGKTYYNEFQYEGSHERQDTQELAILQYLGTLDFYSVLDVGCGFGRITKLIMDWFKPYECCGIDLSDAQITKAKELVKGVQFDVCTIQDFEPNRKYNLVIACEVLLHVPPSDIQATIDKLKRLSTKHVVNIDPIQGATAPHNFNHDYASLYGGATMKEIEGVGQWITHHTIL